jgi:hypothetical protein
MWNSYKDIRDRAGEPDWWSDGGLPRYGTFDPHDVTVYGRYVAFVRIACQCCDQEFRVAVAPDSWIQIPVLPKRESTPDPWDAIGSFHFGDAPYHDCIGAGETMNSVPLEVLEFWKRENLVKWERDVAYEFVLPTLEESIEL